MHENSSFKNADFDAPIIHNQDSEFEGDTPKRTTSGDIPAYLNISIKCPRNCTLEDLKAHLKSIHISNDESISKAQTPVQVPIQQIDINNLKDYTKEDGGFIEVKSRKKKIGNGGPKTRAQNKKK